MVDDDYEIYLMVKFGTLDDMCAYVEERNDVVMCKKNGVFIWHNLKKEIVLFDIVHVFIDVCDFFCRMADDDGRWYDGLIDEWDKEHRARAIENGQVRSKTGSIFVVSHLCSCIDY